MSHKLTSVGISLLYANHVHWLHCGFLISLSIIPNHFRGNRSWAPLVGLKLPPHRVIPPKPLSGVISVPQSKKPQKCQNSPLLAARGVHNMMKLRENMLQAVVRQVSRKKIKTIPCAMSYSSSIQNTNTLLCKTLKNERHFDITYAEDTCGRWTNSYLEL